MELDSVLEVLSHAPMVDDQWIELAREYIQQTQEKCEREKKRVELSYKYNPIKFKYPIY